MTEETDADPSDGPGGLTSLWTITNERPRRSYARVLQALALLILPLGPFVMEFVPEEPVLVVMCFAAPVLFGLLSIRLGHPDPPGGVGVLALVTYLAPIGFHLLMAGGPDAFISTVGGLDVPPILLAIGWPFVVVGFPIFVLVFFATVET